MHRCCVGNVSVGICAAIASPGLATAGPTTDTPELTPALRRDTAILEAETPAGSRAQVYVLGVSHVSRKSCEEVRELIQAVKPDVVVLELCKDRLRLLLDQVGH